MKKILLTVMGLLSLCGHAQLPTETFESPWVGTPAAPPGWTVVNEAGSLITWKQSTANSSSYPAFAGNYAAFLDRENTAPSDLVPKDWLISPSFAVPANGALQFYSRLSYLGDQGGIYKVLISTDPDATNLSAYTEIYSANEIQLNPVQLSYTQKTIALPPVSGTARVAFVMIGRNADRWLVDNVSVSTTCAAPTNVAVTSLSLVQATVDWIENGTATMWEIELVQAGSSPSGIPSAVANTKPFTLAALAAGEYKVYVRSLCPDGGRSPWSTPVDFATPTNVVRGNVQYDVDGNGSCDTTDPAFSNTEVKVSTNGVYTYSVYTDTTGHYNIYGLADGNTTLSLQVVAPQGFGTIAPLEQVVEFGNGVLEQNVNHCIAQAAPVTNLRITISPTIQPRPGFATSYRIQVKNLGNTVVGNATATLTYNASRITFVDSDNPSATHTTGTLVINLGDLAPFASQYTIVNFNVLTPPVNIGGEQLHFTAALSDVAGDVALHDNTALLNQVIVNSYDPNDITVHEGAERYLEEAEDYLTYTIRFQNTGTAEAINIKLENTLDELLDWNTFEPLASSHGYTAERLNDQLTFKFNGINLPDSTANEPESHGFVTYRVKPKAGMEVGDIVSNTAEIYFDFNDAIVTNTATTEVVWVLDVKEQPIAIAVLYPNPVKDQLQVDVKRGVLQSVTVHDINGRLCLSADANILDTSALNSGVYFVNVTTDIGSANYKIIKH